MRSRIVAIVGACVMLALPALVTGQEARGTLQGRVSDASGAVVPGATVEVMNVNTGVTTPTISNEEGNYRVPFLNPGTYRVTVTLSGFSKYVSSNIDLHVAEVLNVDATLQPGQLTDEVTVTAAAPLSTRRRRGSARWWMRGAYPSCRSVKAPRSSW